MNQGPAGLQPDALPLSYISRYETVGKHVYANRCADVKKKYLSEVGFEPTPSYEDQNSLAYSLSGNKDLSLSLAP